jgi:5'-phosphate synthase pdxT subunit
MLLVCLTARDLRAEAGKRFMKKIGVLSFQGSVREHLACLAKLYVDAIAVNTPETLNEIDGLILPGGESTTLGILLREFGMIGPLQARIKEGMPVWGTCAGMILLARKITGQSESHLGVMDIQVTRNGYGSQHDSFKTELSIPAVSERPVPLVFIRAPYVEKVWGDVKVLAETDGKIVAARQKNMLATSFHPELTEDLSFYDYFINL